LSNRHIQVVALIQVAALTDSQVVINAPQVSGNKKAANPGAAFFCN
jgi:hypothetical protein